MLSTTHVFMIDVYCADRNLNRIARLWKNKRRHDVPEISDGIYYTFFLFLFISTNM